MNKKLFSGQNLLISFRLEDTVQSEMLSVIFFALFLVGSLMLILGIFLLIYLIFNNREKVPQQKSKTLSSGIIMIGPIPIIFGGSKWFYIIPIAAIVTIFLILLLFG
jgi:uncharacterized protein (TIGR00304 family)